MRLDADLSLLRRAVVAMGAQDIQFDDPVSASGQGRERVDWELPEGIEVDIDDIETLQGLLTYQNRHVLLYIQDHGWDVEEVLAGRKDGRKFHVAWCATLKEMKRIGRFQRYVATNDCTGDFTITGSGQTKSHVSGKSRLNVCKNCLRELNHDGYRHDRNGAFARFDLQRFFETYSSYFPHKPMRVAGEDDGSYSVDWREVSRRVRESANYTCEECGVRLDQHKSLLHVHHVNGVKTDNSGSNLKALCASCHRLAPHHAHMHVPHKDTQQIAKLRREQGLHKAVQNWPLVSERADPAMRGLIDELRRHGETLPEVGYPVESAGNATAFLELAWPARTRGVAISPADKDAAQRQGWNVREPKEALDEVAPLDPHPSARRRRPSHNNRPRGPS